MCRNHSADRFSDLNAQIRSGTGRKVRSHPRELERKVKSYLENRTDANHWPTIIRQYTEITELDESILFELDVALRLEKLKKWADSGFVTSVFTTAMSEMWTRR